MTTRSFLLNSLIRVCIAFLLAQPSATAVQEQDDASTGEFADQLKPFLTKYCLECHQGDEPSGDRDLTQLTGAINTSNDVVDYQDMLDQLNLSDMPPSEAAQPSTVERRQAIDWLTDRIRQYHESRADDDAAVVLRRLNAREYRATIRDLLHIDVTMFHPDDTFPRDQVSEHLDNVGDALVTSGFLLAKQLEAADAVVSKAMGSLQQSQVQTWSFQKNFRQQPEIDQVHGKTNGFSRITLYDVKGADKPEGAYAPIHEFRDGVPLDGYYEIRFRAAAVNRQHPYDPEFLGTDPDEPLRLGIVAGNSRVGPLHKQQPIEPQLAEFELADEEQWYSAKIWLDAGYTPRFTFINGLMDVRGIWGKLIRKYPDQFPEQPRKGIVADRFNAIKFGKLPQIHIHEIEIKGPFYDSWPTPSQKVLLEDDWAAAAVGDELPEELIRAHVQRVASLAYRRPATDAEVDQVMSVYRARRADGSTQLNAYADGVRMILCSPNFLYLEPAVDGQLSPWAIASRLSYFLWSSLPDRELLSKAEDGTILDPGVLRQQANRMLNDHRSDALVAGFTDSWLALRDLGSMPPDRGQFRAYYHYDLDSAMREETRLFVRHLIAEDLSILNCIDSDFTFVNRPLARFYGLPVPEGPGFERVSISDDRRGGLLGQASILTVSANGIDTSPVVRGVWVLENLLGDPPQPPPPDVEPLDPDIRGATTIREQLEKHRQVASCNDCHRSIDPMGFALENFDPIGGWRTRYGKNRPIDASGTLPDGQQYQSVVEFRRLLLGRSEQFARALAGKLLAYAIGRHVTSSDRPHVDRIVRELAEHDHGMRELIFQVVTSEPFLQP